MKKLLISALAILLLSIGLLESRQYIDASSSGGADTITIFNWGEYIDPSLLEDFTEETGIQVIYETFDSNEALFTKIKSGSTNYDLIMPSEYMIQKMNELGLLQEIDKSKISNFSNLDPMLVDRSFDPQNKYSVPYFWGTLGIVYNPTLAPEDLTFEDWNDLWDERLTNDVILVDGSREMLGIALQSDGYSVNETDEVRLKLAEAKLELMGRNVKAINNDEKVGLMANNEAAVAVTFSGNAALMMADNEDLVYVVPKTGSNIWFDNMAIPKIAKNSDAAHKFIEFMLRPENAKRNAEFVGYATPVSEALDLLPEEITSDEAFYPTDETRKHLEIYESHPQKIVQLQNDLFLEFKININRK